MYSKIIVVEDNIEDVEIIKYAFNQLKYDLVDFCPDAYALINHLKKLDKNHMPKLAVVDYNLPSLNGFSIATFLKSQKDYSSITVVVMSGVIPQNEEYRLLKAGVAKVYEKPTSLNDYVKVVSELISLTA
ncbi:response regulator [Segetibacter sp.]|jgi:DNA-binding response OmpR family regulator|uniref:response regulator n=1 Tax=Segetibacter sp. TaxID=2231182 RepID=UPI00262750A4|nr:response regulator [Segetibacter sp.]MCW3080001.1 response regulator receiver [Segetibacter sp.]